MTLSQLSQLYHLEREIAEEKQRYKVEKDEAIKKIIDKKVNNSTTLQREIEEYIAEIPNSLTRRIFTMRFLKFYKWEVIAYKIGGGNTKDSVKKICYRYIKKSCKK